MYVNKPMHAAEIESIIKLIKNDLDQILQNLDSQTCNPENYNIQFYKIKHLANKIEKIEGIIINKTTSIENIAFYLFDILSKTYSHLYDYHRNSELFVNSKKASLSVNNKLIELCRKAFWLYNTYLIYDSSCRNMMVNHINNLACLETKEKIMLSEYAEFMENFASKAQNTEIDSCKPSEFELLAQIVDEIEKDLKNTKNLNLKKALQNELRRRNQTSSLIEHIKNDEELKRFIDAFKDACKIQICFIIDITKNETPHYHHFVNQLVSDILDAAVRSYSRSISLRCAYIGYRERNEEYEFHQFTDNIAEIREAIRKTEFGGGGSDTAEDVEFALDLFINEVVFNRRGTRIIIHIADAPCHGKRYHESNIDDSHPEWSDNIPDLLGNINRNYGCFYWFVKITDNTDKMITEFNEILKTHNDDSTGMFIRQIDFKGSKGNFKQVIEKSFQEDYMRVKL